MKVSVFGSGYAGLVSGACFADAGHRVVCVDVDKEKIENLKKGIMPIFEPGLSDMVKRGLESGTLTFTTDMKEAVENSEICMIAVGTPPDKNGHADMKFVHQVAADIGRYINDYKIIVDKSTVPVGTAYQVRDIVKRQLATRKTEIEFDVVSNPEFLKEGVAIRDFSSPDRVVIGVDNERSEKKMRQLYDPFFRLDKRIITMDVKSAEMTKYAANCMLACRVTFMNEMANICDRIGADIDMVRKGIGSDQRIGKKYLFPGIGFGGSCFPKDINALINTARNAGYESPILDAIIEVNKRQKKRMTEIIREYYESRGEKIKGKKFAVWGLSFKPNTDDMREAPSIEVIRDLLSEGAEITAYDPEAADAAEKVFSGTITIMKRKYDVLDGADALVIFTEWSMFRSPDFDEMKSLLETPMIFDGRNVFDPVLMEEKGFSYISIGRRKVNC